jgi:hypothetical protein
MPNAITYIHWFPDAVTPAELDAIRNAHGKPESCPDCKPYPSRFPTERRVYRPGGRRATDKRDSVDRA